MRPGLARTRGLGFGMMLALVVGNMIGSGVFMLPATLAPLGLNALAGWGVTIAGAMALAWVFARLAVRLPVAGGPYAYVEAAFGHGPGFAVAWSYWVLLWSGNGAIAVGAVSALSEVVPALRAPAAAAGASLALVWLFVGINIRGVALAGRVQQVTTVLKLLPLALVIGLGGWLLLGPGHAPVVHQLPVPLSARAIAQAAALTFWGFLGVEAATVPADKVVDPARTIPRATLIGTGLTGAVYLAVAASLALLVAPAQLASSPAPVADFLGQAFGGTMRAVIAVFAAISALGALNGFILLQGEMPWAMARGGVFPGWFAAETPQGTPARAHVVSGLLLSAVMLLNFTGSTGQLFADIAAISLAAGMLAYFASAIAALKLVTDEPVLRLAAILAAFFVAAMVWGLGARANLWGLALLGAGMPIYLLVRRAPISSAGSS